MVDCSPDWQKTFFRDMWWVHSFIFNVKSFRKFCGTIWHFYFSRIWPRTFYFTARTPLCKYIGVEMLLTSCWKSGRGSLHCKVYICTLHLYMLGNWNTHCTKPEVIRRLKLLKSSCRLDYMFQISKKSCWKDMKDDCHGLFMIPCSTKVLSQQHFPR